ncbi:peptide ABC transporter substrate-binding protein [Furfurilactobacillus entadae]|uniref:peptide ABC transporter substrate-binding protein n=1 Tax=Furfurilactobacillus entadae TaxID=2922307 RepID=UPI0035E6F997
MSRMKRSAITVGLLLTLTLTLAACGQHRTADQHTLNVTEQTEMLSLDPSKATDNTSLTALANSDEGLYRIGKNNTPQPALAAKTTVSKDGLNWTITLRKNTKWSNGDSVTAADFVYAWQRTNDPKTAGQYAYLFSGVKNADEIQAGKAPVSSLGIQAVGSDKLKITLTKPIPYFKLLLGFPVFFPQNERVVNAQGKHYGLSANAQVYNGPFTIKGWTGTNPKWTLARNSQYWDRRHVKLQNIHFAVVKDASTSLNLYNSGATDLTTLSSSQVANEKSNPAYHYRAGSASAFIGLNQTTKSPLQQLAVRQALSLAINRKQLTNDTLQDGSTPATGLTPAKLMQNPQTGADFAKETSVKAVTTADMAKATRLARAGLKASGQSALTINLLANDTGNSKQVAEYLQSQWNKLPGITVHIQTVPLKAQLSAITTGKYQAAVLSWSGDYNDPETFLSLFQSTNHQIAAKWTDKTFDQAMDQAAGSDANNAQKRYQDLKTAQTTLTRDLGVIPLYWGSSVGGTLQRNNLHGLVYNTAGVNYNFKNVTLSK